MALDAGAFSFAGREAGLYRGFTISLGVGSFTLTMNPATFRNLAPDPLFTIVAPGRDFTVEATRDFTIRK